MEMLTTLLKMLFIPVSIGIFSVVLVYSLQQNLLHHDWQNILNCNLVCFGDSACFCLHTVSHCVCEVCSTVANENYKTTLLLLTKWEDATVQYGVIIYSWPCVTGVVSIPIENYGKQVMTSLFRNWFIWKFDESAHLERWCHSCGSFYLSSSFWQQVPLLLPPTVLLHASFKTAEQAEFELCVHAKSSLHVWGKLELDVMWYDVTTDYKKGKKTKASGTKIN